MANDVLSRGKASSPRCTDGHCEIDIRWWQRANLLNPGMMFSCEWSQNRIAVAGLRVAIEENRVLMNYHNISERRAIDLAWTSCHFGGSRAWFRCPEVTCGRLAAILYAERNFVCRRCARLVYQSQREGLLGRAISRIEKSRHRLGWSRIGSILPIKSLKVCTGKHLMHFSKSMMAILKLRSLISLEHKMKLQIRWNPPKSHSSRQKSESH